MSSGGLNKIDLKDQRFGKLLVIKQHSQTHKGQARWECICDCGNIITPTSQDLRVRNKISCGCLSMRKCGENNPKWSGYKEISGSYWHSIKSGAKSRGLELSITLNYIWDLFIKQNRRCAISGKAITLCSSVKVKIENLNAQTASLDRIDNSKGYIEGNVQWVHKDINKIRMDMDLQKFIDLCVEIAVFNSRMSEDVLDSQKKRQTLGQIKEILEKNGY